MPTNRILGYAYYFCDKMPVVYTQLRTESRVVFYCRGGGYYNVYSDMNLHRFDIKTSKTIMKGDIVLEPTKNPPQNQQSIYYKIPHFDLDGTTLTIRTEL